MPVPVIIAVGHTTDKYILDEISKYSRKTPTDAAYLLIDLMDKYLNDIDFCWENINVLLKQKIELYSQGLENIYLQIQENFKNEIVSLNNNIDNYWNIIKSFSPERLVNN
jgi:exonuclease VII large subunit